MSLISIIIIYTFSVQKRSPHMIIKNKLIAVAQVMLIASGISYFSISSATTCTANTSPTADCTGLIVDSLAGNITVDNSVTQGAGGVGRGIYVESPNGAVNILQINSAGSVVAGTSALPVLVTGIAIQNSGSISYIINNGVISAYGDAGSGVGILNASGHSIGTITNTGSIFGKTAAIDNQGTITVINNFSTTGSASSGIYTESREDIKNTGSIGTLNNAQSNTTLVLSGKLPTNYNIIINSASSYGQLAGQSLSSAPNKTTFGIYAGSRITTNAYSGVLNGLSAANLNTTSGTYQGMTWTLNPNSTFYDLIFSGTNAAVMSALNQTTNALQNAFTLQNTVLVNGFTYDCPVFDKNNVCVSVGARTTAVNTDSVNSTGGLLIGAYRMNNQVRMGAYIDQNISTNSTGIVKVANASPMVGVFGVWNERQDGTGTEVKVSAGYGQKNTTMTRPVVDGTEAGSGSSTLTSQGVQAIGKYGFAVADKTIVSPYAGLRYTQNNMGGYTEGSSASVTAPLTYSAVNTNATTFVAGLGANYKVMPDVTLLASAGLENDLTTSNGTYSATGLYGLNSISFNSSPVRTRATASAGAYYDLAKNQRVSLNYIFRQEPFQGVNTNAAFLTYAIGL